MQTADLAEVYEAIGNARASGQKVSLLIGAGCSVTAGIPVASGIVKRISELFPAKHAAAAALVSDAVPPNYQQCMARLAPLERRRLMAEYVDNARINWAHIGIACLIRAGIVDRVLTVNFDPLIIRACALLNEFPGIYDFAASQAFDASHVADRAVFYLHGQQSGFVQLHTREQVEEHAKRLAPVFEDAGRSRLWIVVGYSGENDPVIGNLAKLNSFANGLYWVGRPNSKPPASIAETLLAPAKSGFFVECAGADEFFLLLARQVACFPPPLLATPFSHLASVYDTLVQEFPSLDVGNPKASNKHPLDEPRSWIADAIIRFEETIGSVINEKSFVLDRYLAGDHQAIIEKYQYRLSDVPEELVENVLWSFIASGNAIGDQAVSKSGDESDRLFDIAEERYALALKLNPKSHHAFYNWGVTLAEKAKGKSGGEAHRLLDVAEEKFAAALAIKPDKEEALFGWASALLSQARGKAGAEAELLFESACEKYEAAFKFGGQSEEVLANWGSALGDLANLKEGSEADQLFEVALEKMSAALKINPDSHSVLNNWGITLADLARKKSGTEARQLFELAAEKYGAALAIKPDKYDALYNWGNALHALAKATNGEEAVRLFSLAGDKYAAALAINPHNEGALYNWGNTLNDQAKLETPTEADRLFGLAGQKYAAALSLKPDMRQALMNWSISLSHRAKIKTGQDADDLLALSKEKRAAAERIAPPTDL